MKYRPHAKLHHMTAKKLIRSLEEKNLEAIFMTLKRIQESGRDLPETSDLFSCNSDTAMFYNRCVETYNSTELPHLFVKQMIRGKVEKLLLKCKLSKLT